MNTKLKYIVISIAALTLSSCYNYKSMQLLQESNSKSKLIPFYEKSEYKEYKIRVNDEVIFRLITADEDFATLISPQSGNLGTQNQIGYKVYSDGSIDIPYVDSIQVAGLTIAEATQVMEARIRKLIPDAKVRLSISNKSFTMLGDAGTGVYQIYKDKMTIFQALAMGSDFSETSDRRHVKIIRETDKGTVVLNFDIRPKSIIDSKYYYVYPNDIIYVSREFSSFYKVNSYSSLLGVITFSVSLLFNVLIYTK